MYYLIKINKIAPAPKMGNKIIEDFELQSSSYTFS